MHLLIYDNFVITCDAGVKMIYFVGNKQGFFSMQSKGIFFSMQSKGIAKQSFFIRLTRAIFGTTNAIANKISKLYSVTCLLMILKFNFLVQNIAIKAW